MAALKRLQAHAVVLLPCSGVFSVRERDQNVEDKMVVEVVLALLCFVTQFKARADKLLVLRKELFKNESCIAAHMRIDSYKPDVPHLIQKVIHGSREVIKHQIYAIVVVDLVLQVLSQHEGMDRFNFLLY